ncbi:MAG: GNAT family N-acetyltransferase [Actinomycetota bacterium]|nr:GNAT family N-acetyltransferase [Actinomycetota bacterium]
MFVTRATRHDRADIEQLYEEHGWGGAHDLGKGTAFIARDGGVVGALRVVEVEPNTLVIDGVLVKDGRRNEGIGRRLMTTAMTSRGGTMYLCCHDDRLRFYGHFGFAEIPVEEAPESVRDYWTAVGDWPTEPGHEHFFLKAR